MKVFVLTRGEYSDYAVCGVVATRELAEQIVAKRDGYRSPDQFIEFEVWDTEPVVPQSTWSVEIEVGDSGDITYRREDEITRRHHHRPRRRACSPHWAPRHAAQHG